MHAGALTERTTERLRLRPWRPEDIDPYARFFADEAQARYVGGACDRPTAWRRMATQVGHWTLRGHGYWALEERSSGAFVGSVGLWFPEGWPEIELGYWLVPEHQGRGLATEAALEARRCAYELLRLTTLVSYIHPENAASQQVAKRLGAELDEVIELVTHGPHGVWRHPGP